MTSRTAALFAAAFFCAHAISAEEKQPPVHECFKVHGFDYRDKYTYIARAENTCPYTIKTVYVLVKFFDKDWNRIGTSSFGGAYIAKGEKLKTILPVPEMASAYRHVGVRRITTDSLEALK